MAEVPGPVQGSPTPEASSTPTAAPIPATPGMQPPGAEAATPTATSTPDSFVQPAHPEYYQPGTQAEFNTAPMALHEGPDRFIKAKLPEEFFTQIREDVSPEFRARMSAALAELLRHEPMTAGREEKIDTLTVGAREYAKESAGVKDTADLDPKAQKIVDAMGKYWKWVLGKIR